MYLLGSWTSTCQSLRTDVQRTVPDQISHVLVTFNRAYLHSRYDEVCLSSMPCPSDVSLQAAASTCSNKVDRYCYGVPIAQEQARTPGTFPIKIARKESLNPFFFVPLTITTLSTISLMIVAAKKGSLVHSVTIINPLSVIICNVSRSYYSSRFNGIEMNRCQFHPETSPLIRRVMQRRLHWLTSAAAQFDLSFLKHGKPLMNGGASSF